MVIQSLNHIQGGNRNYWNPMMMSPEADKYCIVAVDVAKYANAATSGASHSHNYCRGKSIRLCQPAFSPNMSVGYL